MAIENVTLPDHLAGLTVIADLYREQVTEAVKLDPAYLASSIGKGLESISTRGVHTLALIDLAIKHAPDDLDTRAILEAMREMSLADGRQIAETCGEVVACFRNNWRA